jgi:transposase
MCKVNFAASVRVFLPSCRWKLCGFMRRYAVYVLDSCGYLRVFVGVNSLTLFRVRHIYIYMQVGGPMEKSRTSRKTQALRQHGSLNPRSEGVSNELFQTHEFFDPDDLVQVKYEMLRQVVVEHSTVAEAAAGFGLSRPSYYEAEAAFEEGGLLGLVPQKRGPRRAHKLSAEVMQFLRAAKAEDPTLSGAVLRERLWTERRLRVHRRSIERALARGQKKLPTPMPEPK